MLFRSGARGFQAFLKCFEKGILVRVTGGILAFSPPLVISERQIDELVETVANVLRAS